MDGSELLLTTPVMPPEQLDGAASLLSKVKAGQNADGNLSDTNKTEKLAKDFESVLVTKLFDSMKDTVTELESQDEEDAAGGQVKGMFWMYMAQDVSEKGGFGLWKDLQRFFTDIQNPAQPPAQTIDEGI